MAKSGEVRSTLSLSKYSLLHVVHVLIHELIVHELFLVEVGLGRRWGGRPAPLATLHHNMLDLLHSLVAWLHQLLGRLAAILQPQTRALSTGEGKYSYQQSRALSTGAAG